MTIIYLPLESYQERYTYQLKTWMETRLKERQVPYIIIEGTNLRHDETIKTGQVLDAFGRPYYALTQMANLVALLDSNKYGADDVIFSEDMFQPGYEAFPYIMEQLPIEKRPKFFTRCLAQSIDPDDFVHPWRHWMRPFEHIVDETTSGIMMASTEMGLHYHIANLNKAPLYVTGLPFDKNEVRSRVKEIKPIYERKKRIAFASRWDKEKQPGFYMDLIEKCANLRDPTGFFGEYEFAIFTGSKKLRSNKPEFVERAIAMQAAGKLKIYENLTKNEFYALLADSQVHFTSSLQDWRSNLVNESSSLGVLPLHGAYRSFPEAIFNEAAHLYVPWSLDDAKTKLEHLLVNLYMKTDICDRIADEGHACLDRTIDILLNKDPSRYEYKDR